MNIADVWHETLKERDLDVSVAYEMKKHCEVMLTKEVEPLMRGRYPDIPEDSLFLCLPTLRFWLLL